MAKSRPQARVTATAVGRKTPRTESAHTNDFDVARRAYDIYLTRGRAHGHDVDDWLQAERELGRGAAVAP